MVEIGKICVLRVVRDSRPGMYLDGAELGEILLPNRYVPRGLRPGDRLEVFVYRDSEDRLVATTAKPRATVGEVASLKVVALDPRIGVFLDWGLSKDLLLPFREQTGPVRVGQTVLVRVCLDPKTDRIVASMKVDRMAGVKPVGFSAGEPVEFILTEQTELGFKALVEGAHAGLLYHDGIAVPVKVGQKVQGFIRAVRPDGKIDLSMDQAGFKRVAPLARKILQALEKGRGHLEYDDDSSPEAIRAAFGVSKKAFKQALGTLYKSRRIRFAHPGIELLDNSSWEPGRTTPDPRSKLAPAHRRPRKPARS